MLVSERCGTNAGAWLGGRTEKAVNSQSCGLHRLAMTFPRFIQA
jgi:hypothetical protein